jgi:Leucine-rich repeat (LRR) protein
LSIELGKYIPRLKRLTLNGNQLESISLGKLDELVLLSLESNKIHSIPAMSQVPNLVHLNLRGNKLQSGFDELAKLSNLQVLDMSRCMIEMNSAQFQQQILAHLIGLKRLEFLCLGDNPILTQYPDLKYITINDLPQLHFYDYREITSEVRYISFHI